VSLLCERRASAPWGFAGGADAQPGRNRVLRAARAAEELPGSCTVELDAGDVLVIETPGGGGFGAPGS
jgi:5-oxoprolinase (ATP-hydrolysing)